MNTEYEIRSPDDPALDRLCDRLAELANDPALESAHPANRWPSEQMKLLDQAGVYRWFIPEPLGGFQWSNAEIVTGYLKLSQTCLTSTFIVTQRVAAISRICYSKNLPLQSTLLSGIISGEAAATVGISHLTTSRQHVKQPALKAVTRENGFTVDGLSPWVTGASAATHIVMGAQLDNGQQILFAAHTNSPELQIEPGFDLVGLSGSQTGAVKCHDLHVPTESVLAGPVEDVLGARSGKVTGNYKSSALAVGLARAAINYIGQQASKRPDLTETFNALNQQAAQIESRLFDRASGVVTNSDGEIRADANSLALRATQSALVTAKGTGYVIGHPVGRWCQEALFFLVWSCPQSVLEANLCEFAGLES